MKIEIISGSSRKESVTLRLALHLEKALQSNTDHKVDLIDLRAYEFPHLQKVFTSVEQTPEHLKAIASRVFEAQAFIIVTPEYNGSYSPALKNFFDHFPKQAHKVFGIATASVGAMGGMRASQQLLLFIPALFGIASPSMLVTPHVDKKFDEKGNLIDEGFQKSIDVFVKEYLWLAESLYPAIKYAVN